MLFRYPPEKHPIIALRGAPATFPVEKHNRHLQRYLQWSDLINTQAEEYIRGDSGIGGQQFIGVHLRIGSDWVRERERERERERVGGRERGREEEGRKEERYEG